MKLILLTILTFCSLIFGQAIQRGNSISIELNTNIESSGNSIIINSPTITGSRTITFPDGIGTSGQILTTDGNGSTTWSTVTGSGNPASPNGAVQFNDSDDFGGTSNLFFDLNNDRLGIGTDSPNETLTVNGPVRVGSNGNDGAIYFASNGSSQFIILETDNAMTGTQIQIYILPENDGDVNQGLLTDGNGNLSWGGDIKVGPVSQDDPDNIDITGNPSNVYVGGGSGHDINNNPDNVVIFGGTNNQITNNTENSGILGGTLHDMNNNQVNTAILGGDNNRITNNSDNSVIANGDDNSLNNQQSFSMIGSGRNNNFNSGGSDYTIIVAGLDNDIDNTSTHCFTGAGQDNDHDGNYNTLIAGEGLDVNSAANSVAFAGDACTMAGLNSFLGAGPNNSLDNDYSVIFVADNSDYTNNGTYLFNLYGNNCNNSGNASYNIFGGQNLAHTNNGNDNIIFGNDISNNRNGVIMFQDGNNAGDNPNVDNEWRMKYNQGYRFWTNAAASIGVGVNSGSTSWFSVSDSNMKSNKVLLDPSLFASKIQQLEIYSWNYKDSDPSIRNYSPMAQDFYRLFGEDELGNFGSDTRIKGLDLTSILALGVKGAAKQIENNNESIQKITEKSENIDNKLENLKKRIEAIQDK